MTLAEIFVFILVGLLLAFALRPLQKKIETFLLKLFRANSRESGNGFGEVIDVTDSAKSDRSSQSKKQQNEPKKDN